MNLFVLQPRYTSRGHLVILWRPWISTEDASIGYRSRNMFITQGDSIKQITLYPCSKSITKLQYVLRYDDEASDREIT